MTSRLTVEYDKPKGLYFLAWSDPEEGVGLYVERTEHVNKPEPLDRDMWECWIAAKSASSSKGVTLCSGCPTYFWESQRDAMAARVAANTLIKHGRSMPEWAEKAIAAGWKAPKGWKP